MKEGSQLKRLFGYDLDKLSFDNYPPMSRPVTEVDGVACTMLADSGKVLDDGETLMDVFKDLERFGTSAVPRMVLFLSELTKGVKTREAMGACGMDWGMINLCLRMNKKLRKLYLCARDVQLEAMGNEVVDAAWRRVVDGYDEVVTNTNGVVYDDEGKPVTKKIYCDGRLAERLLMVGDKRFSPESTGERGGSGIVYNINGDVNAYVNATSKGADYELEEAEDAKRAEIDI